MGTEGTACVDELLRGSGPLGCWFVIGIHDVKTDVPFEDLCHQGIDGAAACGDRMEDIRAIRLALDCVLDVAHTLDNQRFELRQISSYFFVTSGKVFEVGKKRGINGLGVDIGLEIHRLASQQVTAFSGFGIDE